MELQSWKNRYRELEDSLKRDWQIRINKLEQQNSQLGKDNEELNWKLNQANPRIADY